MNDQSTNESHSRKQRPKRDTGRIWLWLAKQLVSAFAAAFLVYHALCFLLDEETIIALMRRRYLTPGGWLVHDDFSLRRGAVFMVALAFGICLPGVRVARWVAHILIAVACLRLPRWLSCILLGGMVGALIALIGMGIVDAILTGNAVSNAIEQHPELGAPANQWLFVKADPSAYRVLFTQILAAGFCCGFLAGGARASSKKRRLALLATSLILTVTLSAHLWTRISDEIDSGIQTLLWLLRDD